MPSCRAMWLAMRPQLLAPGFHHALPERWPPVVAAYMGGPSAAGRGLPLVRGIQFVVPGRRWRWCDGDHFSHTLCCDQETLCCPGILGAGSLTSCPGRTFAQMR